MNMKPAKRDIFFTSQDGLALYAADYGPEDHPLPIIALSGLTRNHRDFEPLVACLPGERIIAPDYRGRGLSQWAEDGASYSIANEATDVLALMQNLQIHRAIFLGTSRGGLISLALSATHPQIFAGLILNDIGPRLEAEGLLRIRDYIGAAPPLPDWPSAAKALKRTNPGFDGLSDEDWLAFAKRIFRQYPHGIVADYDPKLAETFPSEEAILAGLPELWEFWQNLPADLPKAVIRGQNSDLLSSETMQRMAQSQLILRQAEVPNRAHVPFLNEPEAVEIVKATLELSLKPA